MFGPFLGYSKTTCLVLAQLLTHHDKNTGEKVKAEKEAAKKK